MNILFQKLAESKSLQEFIGKHYAVFVKKYVPGETLEELKPLLQRSMTEGYHSILHPIQLHKREAEPYLEAIHFLEKNNLDASVALRLPLEGNLDDLVRQACHAGIKIEIDMREAATIDETIREYKKFLEQHPNTMLCLQANLRRTEQDIANLLHYNPPIRLVKGAFKETKDIAYQKKKDIDRNYLQQAQQLLLSRGRKLALATHDEAIIAACLEFAEKNNISKERLEFQMLYGVKEKLQENLKQKGYPVGRYIVYGKDWFPYLMNRLWERKKYILPLLCEMLKDD